MKEKSIKYIEELIKYDAKRKYSSIATVYYLIATVNLIMTVVNLVTKNYVLALITSILCIYCSAFAFVIMKNKSSYRVLIYITTIGLVIFLNYFIITGMAEGFTPLWVLLVPICILFLFGKKHGTVLCLAQFAILVFLFYIPAGKNFLQYKYPKTFLNRYPILFMAFFAVAWYIENSRDFAYKTMTTAKEHYQHMYIHDALTGIYNRYGFNDVMNRSIKNLNQGDMLALIIIDIDHFKHINDKYGHLCGDIILKCMAETISNTISEKGVVCRWGGEEFAVLITDKKYCEEYEKIAESVRTAIEKKVVFIYDNCIKVTVSIGGSRFIKNYENNAYTIINIADNCLYEAKKSGRNRTICKDLK